MALLNDDKKTCEVCGKVFYKLKPRKRAGYVARDWARRRLCSLVCAVARARESDGNLRHGHARKGHASKEFRAYCAMKNRCYTTSHKDYHSYGGRGISVCPQWSGRDGFVVFLSDVGTAPDPSFTLDRIDVNANYEPGNVRWATRREQALNKQGTAMDGGVLILELAQKTGIKYHTLMDRWRRGDTGERLLRPVGKCWRHAR